MDLRPRVEPLTDKLDRLVRDVHDVRPAELQRKLHKRAEAILERAEKSMQELADDIAVARKPITGLGGSDRVASLVDTVATFMREHRGLLLAPDALQGLVVQHSPPAHAEYWAALAPEQLSGLLRHEKAVAERLEAEHGLLSWCDELDIYHRIVNTRWLVNLGDIWRFATSATPPGRRCAYCHMIENPMANQLVALDARERENGATSINGVYQLHGSVQIHAPCTPYLKEWLRMASRYPNAEAAEQADVAAGRAPSQIPPLPQEVSDG